MVFGLRFGNRAAFEQLVDVGVVFGELVHGVVAQHVQPRVANMTQDTFVATRQEKQRAGRPHAGLLGILAGHLVDGLAGRRHRRLDLLRQRFDIGVLAGLNVFVAQFQRPGEFLLEDLTGGLARHLARVVAAHSVGHHKKTYPFVSKVRVFVVGASAANVRPSRNKEFHT